MESLKESESSQPDTNATNETTDIVEEKGEETEKNVETEKCEKPEIVEKAEKPEIVEKVEKPAKIEKVAKVIKAEEPKTKVEKNEKNDKNSMVMKYVEVEKRCIELSRQSDFLQAKLTEANKERLRLIERLEAVKPDMDKMSAELDKKVKEAERLKEQFVLSDAREKAAQLKLTREVEAHAVTQRKLDQITAELSQLKSQEAAANSDEVSSTNLYS